MRNYRKEAYEAVKEDRLWDYIANNYWKMEKDDIKEIALAILGAFDDLLERSWEQYTREELLTSAMEERGFDEEEEE